MRYFQIDLNRRNREGYSPASFRGAAPMVGESVMVFEPEDGVQAPGQVAHVDVTRQVVLIDVQWDDMRDYEPLGHWQDAGTSNGGKVAASSVFIVRGVPQISRELAHTA